MTEEDDFMDIGPMRLNKRPLLNQICEHAQKWKIMLGEKLTERTKNEMLEFKAQLDTYDDIMSKNVKDLDSFKLIMTTITEILRMSVAAELKYSRYQETFYTIQCHNLPVADDDYQLAYDIETLYQKLYLIALYRSQTLEATKGRFAEMTQAQISNFLDVLNEFVKRYDEEGPGTVGEEMDRGMNLLDDYEEEMVKLDKKRLDLQAAELLFDQPLTDYSEFLRVKQDMQYLQMIYKQYADQRAARNVWGKTLWVNLNAQALVDGIETFMKEFRKLPRIVRTHPMGVMLDLKMKQFKSVVPLMVSLKNEAMRERHWKILMEKTGRKNVFHRRSFHRGPLILVGL